MFLLLAKRAAMSERSFIRAFREDTGQSPAEYVMSARIQEARRLLEQTELAPKIVAQRCGLGSTAAMRRVFLRELGISAAEYRDKFRAQVARAVSPSPDRSGLARKIEVDRRPRLFWAYRSGGSGCAVKLAGAFSPSTSRTAGSAASAIAAWPSAVGWNAPP